MPSPTGLLTAQDLSRMPDDGRFYELVRGELVEVPPAKPGSSEIAVLISAALVNFVYPRRLGMVCGADGGFILHRNPDTVRAPDAAFIRADRMPTGQQRDFYGESPDLAVEVLSPSDRRRKVLEKIEDYLSAGVRLVWLVDPRARRVTVCLPDRTTRSLGASDVLDGGDVLPGFELPLADLFS